PLRPTPRIRGARCTHNDQRSGRGTGGVGSKPGHRISGSPGLLDCGSSLSRRYFHTARAERLADPAGTGCCQPCAGREKSAGRTREAGPAPESAVVEEQRQSGAGVCTIAGAAIGCSDHTNSKYAKRGTGSGSVRAGPGTTRHPNTVIAT